MMDKDFVTHGPQGVGSPHFSCAGPQVELVIVHGRARETRRKVAGPVFMIGAARDCDLVLADARFPDVHSYIYVRREGVSVRHLGDGPGVEVDGRPVHMTRLVHGDQLRMGPYTFELRIAWPPGVRGDEQQTAAAWEGGESWSDEDDGVDAGWRAAQQLLADLRLLTGQSPALKVVAGERAARRIVSEPSQLRRSA